MNKIISLVLLTACQTVVDPSMNAAFAGDFTIMSSACDAMPGRGADICRVKENTDVASEWVLVLPHSTQLLGGEVTAYYRDISRSYPITNSIVRIPWSDLVGHKQWELSDDGEAMVLAQIRYKNNSGIEEIIKAKGLAILVVTKAAYDLLPIDSGFTAFKTHCDISYSTSGRSAISCK